MLTRRRVLGLGVGAAAALVAGCTPAPRDPGSLLPTTSSTPSATPTGPVPPSAADVDAFIARLSEAAASMDWGAVTAVVAGEEDAALRRLVEKAPSFGGCELSVARGNGDPGTVGADGSLLVPLQVRHRVVGADEAPAGQAATVVVENGPGGLRARDLRFASGTTVMPWNLGDFEVLSTPHLLLTVDPACADVLDQGDRLERAAAAILDDVPDHPGVTRLGAHMIPPGESREIYGIDKQSWHGGITTSVGFGQPVARILLFMNATDAGFASVLRHESVHLLSRGWGGAKAPTFLVEGLATWATPFLTARQRQNRFPVDLLGLVDEAVATRMEYVDFYDPEGMQARYELAATFCTFVESRLGRARVWDLAHRAYREGSGKTHAALAPTLGLPDEAAVWQAWADWLRAELA